MPSASFDKVDLRALRRRGSEKWTAFGSDVLPVHIAEHDFDPEPHVEEALAAAVATGDLGYASRRSPLPEAFAGFAARRWGWEVDPAAVLLVPDVMVGVAELLRLLTRPGAGVVINPPVYPPFFSVIAEVGRTAVEVPLLAAGEQRRLPLDGIADALDRGAEAMLLCNPHNPTGYVAREDELLELAAVARRHGALVLSDEIHAPLTLGAARHVPFCALPGGAGEAAVTLTSATKAWNLAGLKCGLAVAGSPRLREALAALPAGLSDRVGHLGAIASTAAFAQGDPWLDELRAYLDGTHGLLGTLVGERLSGVRVERAQSTYLAWLDCRDAGLGGDPAAVFLERGRVALYPGPRFGAAGNGFARLNAGTSRALVRDAVARIEQALRDP